jgi:hypothetical protein
MATFVYGLCAGAALLCTILLFRAWRRTHTRLLLWSTFCFGSLTVNNVLVLVDLQVLPEVDLFILRTVSALVGVTALLGGLVWESRR